MLSVLDATRQASRLAALRGFGEMGEGALDEFIRVLRENATSEEHAEGVVSRWIDQHRWIPAPAELIELLGSTAAPATVRADSRCKFCSGSGYERVNLLVTYNRHPSGQAKDCEEQQISTDTAAELERKVDGWSQVVATAVKLCRCPYGQGILQAQLVKDAQREERLHPHAGSGRSRRVS